MIISDFFKEYNAPSNTLSKPIFDVSNWEVVKAINDFNNNTKDFFQSVSDLVYYFTHPKAFAWTMWNGLVKYSFGICMFICLFGVIAYIIGWKKGKVCAKGSVIAYIIIMMFNSAL